MTTEFTELADEIKRRLPNARTSSDLANELGNDKPETMSLSAYTSKEKSLAANKKSKPPFFDQETKWFLGAIISTGIVMFFSVWAIYLWNQPNSHRISLDQFNAANQKVHAYKIYLKNKEETVRVHLSIKHANLHTYNQRKQIEFEEKFKQDLDSSSQEFSQLNNTMEYMRLVRSIIAKNQTIVWGAGMSPFVLISLLLVETG